MDGNAAIERNREALKRILAMLMAMAGLRGQFTFFPRQGALPQDEALAEKSKLSPALTLPRRLRNAVLRLLRPAESAARRLVIAAARGVVVPLPPARRPRPKTVSTEPLLRSLGIAVVMSPADLAHAAAVKRAAAIRAARPRSLCLPLFDPLKRPFRNARRLVPAHAGPRILFPGVTEPFCLPPPPSPDDPIDAARLGRRLAALAAALDDLPGQARRFARWKARRTVASVHARPGRLRRIFPLRGGRPPGGLSVSGRAHEVHDILTAVHSLAFCALERPDTS